jgi:DNA-binding MarR family transcriptional regulator
MAGRPTANDFVDLFGLLKRRLRALSARGYALAGMARAQGRFVWHIGHQAHVSQAELARATDTDPALTGRTVQSLIEEGLVRRRRSEEDRRQYVLELTAAGRRALDRVERARAEVGAYIAALLDEQDLRDFERVVRKIVADPGAPTERD